MTNFRIGDQFYIDDEPFKILSGAIHYFRIPRDAWYHSLYNLKALGFNTVETYVPWNVHEKLPGEFDFEGNLDLRAFVKKAEELGLYVILRPSPYICAEWEFGGLPAWLNNEPVHPRIPDPGFIKFVDRYFESVFKEIKDLQFTYGGPILMMQIENEYGSYGEDKDYLRLIYQSMKKQGANVPLFTSDGAWQATLQAGTLRDVDEDILVTGNFGSKAKENFANLKAFHKSIGKDWPLMVMEFWCGWFNRWSEPIVTRETDELVEAIREAVKLGSINLYMFQGGTNFGFMNGCSARKDRDLHQITSYDYGAPLDEQGNPTDKYYTIQRMLKEEIPDLVQGEPLIRPSMEKVDNPLSANVSLGEVLEDISEVHESKYPKSMDELGQYYGYMQYQTEFVKDTDTQERLRIIDARDRANVYLNDHHLATQYQEEIGEDIITGDLDEVNRLDILVENMGRVNYGHKLLADTQVKGIRQGVMSDLHFLLNWKHYLIDFNKLDQLDFSRAWKPNLPAFYKFDIDLSEPEDTFIDLSDFGKGVVIVNGKNLGRYWDVGPTLSLFLPQSYLREGRNEIVIFETEGKYSESLSLRASPVFKNMAES